MLRQRHPLSARRLVLLASVAAIGGAVLLTGPGGYQTGLPAWTSSASAADSTLQHPAGFADIVAKVKPAVISVRVKIAAADADLLHQNSDRDDDVPMQPGSPMEKFFRQFGDRFGQGGPGQGGAAGRRH